MNRTTRILGVLSLTTSLLAGCQATSTSSSQAINPFKVGMECNYAPFNWSTTTANDTTQKISEVDYCDGYDVVIATKIAQTLDRPVQIVKYDWDSLIPGLMNNEIDAIIAGMTETPERAQQVSFTSPYYVSQEVIVVPKTSPLTQIKDIQELSGKTVKGQMNTLYDEVIDQIQGVNHGTPLDNYPALVNDLQHGGADAIVAELPVAQGIVSANPDLQFVTFEEGHGFVADASVSIAINKNNTQLLQDIQNALDQISEDQRQQIMLDSVNRQPAGE